MGALSVPTIKINTPAERPCTLAFARSVGSSGRQSVSSLVLPRSSGQQYAARVLPPVLLDKPRLYVGRASLCSGEYVGRTVVEQPGSAPSTVDDAASAEIVSGLR